MIIPIEGMGGLTLLRAHSTGAGGPALLVKDGHSVGKLIKALISSQW